MIIAFVCFYRQFSNPVSRSIKAHRPGQKPGLFYCADTDSCEVVRFANLLSPIPHKHVPYHISPICALYAPASPWSPVTSHTAFLVDLRGEKVY